MYLFSDCEEDFSSPEVLLFLHKNTSLLVQVLPCTLGCLTLFTRIIISFGYAVFKVRLWNLFHSGDKGIRTLDPLLARQVLSQLSYTPKAFAFNFLKNVWHPPIFPCRYQQSIFGRLSLNRRVRDGNGCFP